jgi:hypothetical protein
MGGGYRRPVAAATAVPRARGTSQNGGGGGEHGAMAVLRTRRGGGWRAPGRGRTRGCGRRCAGPGAGIEGPAALAGGHLPSVAGAPGRARAVAECGHTSPPPCRAGPDRPSWSWSNALSKRVRSEHCRMFQVCPAAIVVATAGLDSVTSRQVSDRPPSPGLGQPAAGYILGPESERVPTVTEDIRNVSPGDLEGFDRRRRLLDEQARSTRSSPTGIPRSSIASSSTGWPGNDGHSRGPLRPERPGSRTRSSATPAIV